MQRDGKVVLLINAPTWLYYSLFEKYKCIKATATFLQRVCDLLSWWFLGGLFRRAFFAVVFYKGVKDKVQQYITSEEDVQNTTMLNDIIEQIIPLR